MGLSGNGQKHDLKAGLVTLRLGTAQAANRALEETELLRVRLEIRKLDQQLDEHYRDVGERGRQSARGRRTGRTDPVRHGSRSDLVKEIQQLKDARENLELDMTGDSRHDMMIGPTRSRCVLPVWISARSPADLLIADLSAGGRLTEMRSERRILRLGEGVDQTKQLSVAAMDRVIAVFQEWREMIDASHVDAAAAVATSAVRDAANRDEFLDRVKREAGFEVELISGEEEARRTMLGIRSGLPHWRDRRAGPRHRRRQHRVYL